jgi:3-oxoadipate enol-lactonase
MIRPSMPFVELDDIVTHYRIDGGAPTTIAFVNSLGADLRIWDEVIPAFRDRQESLRFLRYDLRGHGLTESTPPPYRLETLAEDLARVMDACGTRRAVLCGVSIGGLIALQLAAANPERVSGLILCDMVAKIGDATYWKERMATIQSGGIETIADGALERWFASAFRSGRPADVRGWRNMLVRTSIDGYLGACAALRDGDLRHAARSLRVPTLVLCGSEDGVMSPETVREFAKSVPGAHFELVVGAGHLPCIEQPAAMAETMENFLKEQRLV